MTVNAVDFRLNMTDYFLRLSEEDIYITRHGKVIAIVTDPDREKKRHAWETRAQLKEKLDDFTHFTRDYLEQVIRLMEEIKAAVE